MKLNTDNLSIVFSRADCYNKSQNIVLRQNMAEQLTREQIIAHYHQKMIAALEGGCRIEEVCGLGIETFCSSIIAERDNLLKRYGWSTADKKSTRQTLQRSEKANNR